MGYEGHAFRPKPQEQASIADIEHVSLELRNRLQIKDARESFKAEHPEIVNPSDNEALMEYVATGKAETFAENFESEFGRLGREELHAVLERIKGEAHDPNPETRH